MPGLIDSDTGLTFGTGLQFQTPIGGAGLDIAPSNGPGATDMITEGSVLMITESGTQMITE